LVLRTPIGGGRIMIRQLDGGQRIVTLGYGTTMISDMRLEGDSGNGGILFANSAQVGSQKVSDLPPESVLIQIDNIGGAYAYIRSLLGLLKTWDFTDEIREQLAALERDLILLTESNLKHDPEV
jgi:hypothetical protein